jgi:hypothetical protein
VARLTSDMARHYVLLAGMLLQPLVLLAVQLLVRDRGYELAQRSRQQLAGNLLLTDKLLPSQLPRLAFCIPVSENSSPLSPT